MEAGRNTCAAIGHGLISKSAIYDQFKQLKKKNYDLKEEARPGRPVEVDLDLFENQLKAIRG